MALSNDTTALSRQGFAFSRLPAAAEGVVRPLSMDEVTLAPEGYWGVGQEINAPSIVEHCAHWMETEGWVDNLIAAAEGTLPGARRGREFTDSDVYKLIEAMSWENGRRPTPELEASIRRLIEIVGNAQEPDGYINTNFGRPGQADRYSDLEWGSELYNYGHLLQAAVARVRTTGPDRLLEIATRVADHICDTFGEGGIESVCGHPEIELGLIELARVTGDERYRRQAELFLDRRGHHVLEDIEFGRSYYQDDVPLRDATVFRGHAVRATYLAAAAVDLGIDRGDDSLVEVIRRQLDRTLGRRTYVTGGMGSHFQDEAFGLDFELPSDRAYAETCAGVGSFMLAWRLLQFLRAQPEVCHLPVEGKVVDVSPPLMNSRSEPIFAPVLPDLRTGGGFTLLVRFRGARDAVLRRNTLVAALTTVTAALGEQATDRTITKGYKISVTPAGEIELMLTDGFEIAFSFATHTGVNSGIWDGSDHVVTFIVDGGPRVASVVVDELLDDGGETAVQGWAFHPRGLGEIGGSSVRLAPEFGGTLSRFVLYDRALLTTEAIAAARALATQ